jgi:hypothetical protein
MDDVEAERARSAQYMRDYRKRKLLQIAENENLIPKKTSENGSRTYEGI